ncbi:SusD/RagB family nutrient-binding outer membrane lipoprotein [Tenacibaculum sp. 190524A02b]|uniref:SusD/RagB family nutrient-binding outer membrane lipoprotein n=1 Tax=Tenacibaculum vairaonense TaxID=3137860 RepID=UPI0031FAC9F6
MKTIKFLTLSALAFFTMLSCSDFDDTNIDPNAAVKVPAEVLLTTGQYELYRNLNGVAVNADFGLLMVQHWAQNEYTEDQRYGFDITSFNLTFTDIYTDAGKELATAKEQVDLEENLPQVKANKKHILDIMLVQLFGALTDGFGDIPYTETFSTVSFPKYDSQADIYKGILERLDVAANGLNESFESFGDKADVIYNSDIAKWKKFANSLMLRYAIRVSDADAALATTYVNKAIAGGVFTSNADNANFSYPNVDARANPLYRNYSPQISNRDDYCISKTLTDKLTAMGDPRIDKYAKPAAGGGIVGMPYGLNDNDATTLKPNCSRPNDAVREATTPFHIITYSEVQFLLAEAYQRGIAAGDAQTAYNNAVTASMNQWDITDTAAINTYLAANAYDAGNWKMSIGTQKWIALYMNGFEAWNEWRRLDFPVLTPAPAGIISTIPVKLPYPLSETTGNATNLGQVTSNPADLTAKVWWDKN